MSVINKFRDHLHYLENKQQIRHTKSINKNIEIDFSHNDYLSLSRNDNVINAAIDFARKFGVTSRAARVLLQDNEIYNVLEQKIASIKHTESALLFPTGYQANFSVISALTCKKNLKAQAIVFCDRENHNSIYAGCLNSDALIKRYGHINYEMLEKMLSETDVNTPKFIITETIFSISGSVLDIEKMHSLANKYNAVLYIDETHATGMYGHNGYGISEYLNSSSKISENIIIMSGMNKAMGCGGAFIACSNIVREFLINTCRGSIYSTAISPIIVGAAMESINLIPTMQEERKVIMDNASILRKNLQKIFPQYAISGDNTNIISITFPDIDSAIKVKNLLLEANIGIALFRPPSSILPKIRFTINKDHTKEHIKITLDILENICMNITFLQIS